jgi:hypothetical protein
MDEPPKGLFPKKSFRGLVRQRTEGVASGFAACVARHAPAG